MTYGQELRTKRYRIGLGWRNSRAALRVYVLTEFVYCPRAGICAHETERDEEDDSPPLSFFSFNPLYTIPEIETALQRALTEMTWYIAVAAFSAVLAAWLTLWIDKLVGIAGWFGLLWFLTFAVQRGVIAFQLNQQLKQCERARTGNQIRTCRMCKTFTGGT